MAIPKATVRLLLHIGFVGFEKPLPERNSDNFLLDCFIASRHCGIVDLLLQMGGSIRISA